MQTFNLIINEEQRKLIVEGLESLPSLRAIHMESGETVENFTQMLRDLPKVEAESPHVTHGLCL